MSALKTFVRRAAAVVCLPVAAVAAVRPSIRMLMYHRVCDAPRFDQLAVGVRRFAQQMEWIAAHGEVITLAEAMQRLERGVASNATVITFDDGYLDVFQHALPVLQALQLPATMFVTADFADQSIRHPRYAADGDRLHMNWAEVRRMAATPGMSIGSHTLTHPFLSRLSASDARREIIDSRSRIADELGADVSSFCYPSGDYGTREVDLVREAGYAGAVTVAPGANRAGQDRLQLRRTEINDRDDKLDLALKLRGAYDPIHHILHTRRSRAFARARVAASGGHA